MAFEPARLIVHERVPRVHHGQVVEEDHVAGLELDFDGVVHRDVVESVEGAVLEGCEGLEGGGAGSGGRAGDAGAGAVEEDAAGEVVGEGDGAGVEGPGGRWALREEVSVYVSVYLDVLCARQELWGRGRDSYQTMVQSLHKACASSGSKSSSSL